MAHGILAPRLQAPDEAERAWQMGMVENRLLLYGYQQRYREVRESYRGKEGGRMEKREGGKEERKEG